MRNKTNYHYLQPPQYRKEKQDAHKINTLKRRFRQGQCTSISILIILLLTMAEIANLFVLGYSKYSCDNI